MGRPQKVGLEYFSLDVKMDDEVELIKAQHGIEGFGVLISMYQSIYADKGYYKKWSERNQILFSNKVSLDKNKVTNIINDCIKWDIFNKKLYDKYQILTSERIQKQYIGATYKRSEVKVIEEFLLLNDKDIDRKNISCINVSDVKNLDINIISDSKSTQSNKDKYKDKYKDNKNTSCSDSGESNEVKDKKPKFDKDSMPYRAAKHLRSLILENNSRQPVPDENPKDLEKWALELDRLNRLGPVGAKKNENKGYTWEEIGKIMQWCQDDSFWKDNILSAGKFREKITQLENKMKKTSQNRSNDKMNQLKEIYQEYEEEEGSVEVL